MSIHLNKISTKAPKSFDKERTKEKTEAILEKLDDLQNVLFAESKHSVLVIIQGMDANGRLGYLDEVF